MWDENVGMLEIICSGAGDGVTVFPSQVSLYSEIEN